MFFRRLLTLTLLAAVLLCATNWAYGQESASDQAKALLEQGVVQFKAMHFKIAKKTLLKVEASYLSDSEKKTLDEYLQEAGL